RDEGTGAARQERRHRLFPQGAAAHAAPPPRRNRRRPQAHPALAPTRSHRTSRRISIPPPLAGEVRWGPPRGSMQREKQSPMSKTNVTVVLRPATPADAGTIVQLIRELAVYEKEPLANVKISEADVLRDGFGPERRFECLLVEIDGRAAGFALFFHDYSTWEGR